MLLPSYRDLSKVFCALFCFFLFLPIDSMQARYVTVVPSEPEGMSLHIYRCPLKASEDTLNNWKLLDKQLLPHGLTFNTSNLSEITPVCSPSKIFKEIKRMLFCNVPFWIPEWKEKLIRLPKKKLLLITYEPPSVLPEMYSPEVLDYFDRVLTWDDSLVDNVKFFKFNYAVLQGMINNVVPFSQKKLLTQISGNKTSSHVHELYSERLKVIQFFETREGNDFEFYGTGWDVTQFKNCRGRIDDKIGVLKNYRFSICYENIKEIKGYITEKIFDCFTAGVVPIYWGASNVADYIPTNCFIARENFATFEDLLEYIKNMDEAAYNLYLENIRAYLKSEQAQQFSNKAFAKAVFSALSVVKEKKTKTQ